MYVSECYAVVLIVWALHTHRQDKASKRTECCLVALLDRCLIVYSNGLSGGVAEGSKIFFPAQNHVPQSCTPLSSKAHDTKLPQTCMVWAAYHNAPCGGTLQATALWHAAPRCCGA